jgi:RsiW-degrading membrane proteinase PrsW (M82 family)
MQNVTSAAAQVIIAIIPIVGIVMGCAVVFFYVLWLHRERMLMIEKGSYEPRPIDIDIFSLLVGILLVAVGLTLTIVFIVFSATGYAVLGGLIPLSIGMGFLAFYILRAMRRAT